LPPAVGDSGKATGELATGYCRNSPLLIV